MSPKPSMVTTYRRTGSSIWLRLAIAGLLVGFPGRLARPGDGRCLGRLAPDIAHGAYAAGLVGHRRLDIGVGGVGLLGLGGAAGAGIHVPDLVRDPGGPGDLAPLAAIGVLAEGQAVRSLDDSA